MDVPGCSDDVQRCSSDVLVMSNDVHGCSGNAPVMLRECFDNVPVIFWGVPLMFR